MSSGDAISANITGDISGGQLAVGKHIAQNQTVGTAAVSSEELAQLRTAFRDLASEVEAQAPPERRAAAAERVAELEQAVLAEEPDVTTIQYVARWFRSNLPQLAGAVASIVIHPIVGKLVGAAGDALVAEFQS
jgi:DNA-binding GntR family transcriptional regulator